jgi:hypothetical protein
MSLIANCLAKLARQGLITEKAAKDATAIHDGLQDRLIGTMPPASADAAAAMEAAKIMAEAARREKLRVLKDALAYRDAESRVVTHSHSKIAGLMGVLTRDIRGEGRLNVESLSVATEEWLLGKVNKMMENFRSTMGGLKRDFAGPRNAIKESFGEDTGDPAAKEGYAAFKAAADAGVVRAEKAGITFRSQMEKDQWGRPQFWESSRVKSYGRPAFEKDIFAAWRSGGLDIIDKTTGKAAQEIDVPRIVQEAGEHIVLNENMSAHGSPFNDTMRVFRFKSADSYLKLMDKYGPGEGGYYPMMLAHLRGMAHEIAMTELLGPSYHANFRRLLDLTKLETKEKLSRFNPIRAVESVGAAERTFKALTGELNSVSSELWAGLAGGIRNFATSAKLGAATLTAVPGDSVNALLAARYNGISGIRVMSRAIEGLLTESPAARAEAARLNITANAVIDGMRQYARYGEAEFGARFGQLAGFIIRASGLNFWTQNLKRAFSMEFLAHIAENAGRKLDELNPAFRGFLDRYGFTAAEWDRIRETAPIVTEDGAKFFDSEGLADEALRNRLMSAIIDERQFAVVEATARTRGMMTAGLKRGTFGGEIARSAGMFKSFAMSIILTHGMRSVTSPASLAGAGANLALRTILPMTIAGAVALQAKNILAGKDPRDMSDPMFWFDAGVTGGGSGVYGDLLKAYVAPGFEHKLSELIGGPVVEAIDTAQGITIDELKDVLSGKSTHFGRDLAKVMRQWTPGGTLWYARLGLDRFVHDEIQQAIDPNYFEAFRRQEKRTRQQTGQRFWWRLGHTEPDRPPDLGAALP